MEKRQISIYVSAQLVDDLDRFAESQNLSRGWIIDNVMRSWLAEHGSNLDPAAMRGANRSGRRRKPSEPSEASA